ncbi:MAG: SCO family protein [Sphaerobacter sp.]|nr:SCO family protein [Sphaerobacter sp.]
MRRWIIPVAGSLLILLLVGAGAVAAGWLPVGRDTVHGSVIDPPLPIPDATLTGAGGDARQLSDFRGKVVAIYFGYTYCPDVCPTTLAALARAKQALGKRGDDVQVVMITVDPERDTPEITQEYVSRFDPTFVGLGGDVARIRQVATGMGVYFEKQQRGSAGGYLVDHTATVLVLDRNGDLRLMLPYGLTAEQIADDLRWVLKQ